jgi:YVTN family beta-propeller protein
MTDARRILMMCLCAALLAAAVGCGSSSTNREAEKKGKPAAPRVEEKPAEPAYATGLVVGLSPLAVMTVESGPKSVELMPPDGKRLFVNDLYAHKDFIFDADSYALLKVIPLPDEPVEADFTSDGRFAWVSLYNSSKVLVVDTQAGAVVGEVPTGSIPKEVAVSPDDRWVYVANWNSNTVTVIDARTRARVKDVPVPGTPRGMYFTPEGDFGYVCIMGGSTLAEIDVAAGHVVSRQIPCGSNPRHIVGSRDGSVLYVSNNSPGTVTLLDRKAGLVQATIKVGSQARTITLTPDGRYIFVCNYGEGRPGVGTVGCVDLQARAQIFTVPASMPIGIATSATGDRLFISNYAPPQVTVMQIQRQ